MFETGRTHQVFCDIRCCNNGGIVLLVDSPLTQVLADKLLEASNIKSVLIAQDMRFRLGDENYTRFFENVNPPYGVQIKSKEQIREQATETLRAIEGLRASCNGNFPKELDAIYSIMLHTLAALDADS